METKTHFERVTHDWESLHFETLTNISHRRFLIVERTLIIHIYSTIKTYFIKCHSKVAFYSVFPTYSSLGQGISLSGNQISKKLYHSKYCPFYKYWLFHELLMIAHLPKFFILIRSLIFLLITRANIFWSSNLFCIFSKNIE